MLENFVRSTPVRERKAVESGRLLGCGAWRVSVDSATERRGRPGSRSRGAAVRPVRQPCERAATRRGRAGHTRAVPLCAWCGPGRREPDVIHPRALRPALVSLRHPHRIVYPICPRPLPSRSRLNRRVSRDKLTTTTRGIQSRAATAASALQQAWHGGVGVGVGTHETPLGEHGTRAICEAARPPENTRTTQVRMPLPTQSIKHLAKTLIR
jgi:hypothetical protein